MSLFAGIWLMSGWNTMNLRDMKKANLVKPTILAGCFLLQLSVFCFHSPGAAGEVDLSFDPGSGVNGVVNAISVQSDGKVIIGGQFTTVRGLARTNLARLNTDGSGDPTFVPVTAYNPVYALALQPDGKVLAGGQFLALNCGDWGCDYPAVVVRLNPNGSLDGSFSPPQARTHNGTEPQYHSLVVQPDGKVLVAGDFHTLNGTNRGGIARINADGTLDNSFNPWIGALGSVDSLALQADGKIVTVTLGGLARLNTNGSLDGTFNSDFGVVHPRDCGPPFDCHETEFATTVAVQADGMVLVGVRNEFSQCDPFEGGCSVSVTYRVARLNGNGSGDSSFQFTNVVNNVALLGYVQSVVPQANGRIIVGSSYFNAVKIGRLNSDGSWDSSFTPNTALNGNIETVGLQPDGKVLIGGWFTTVNGTNRNHIARLNTDGALDAGFDPGQNLDRAVATLALQADGKVLAGGPSIAGSSWFGAGGDVLAFVNGTNQHGRLRLHANGSRDAGFTSSPFDPPLAQFFHTEDCTGDPRYGCFFGVAANASLALQDGRVLVGGSSATTITGDETWVEIYRPVLARLTATGALDTTFESVIGSEVNALAQQPDDKILIGGYFSTTNGTHRNIARLNVDGTLDSRFDPGTGANGRVASIALQTDGQVLIGGDFTAVNGTNRDGIARLNSDGSLDGSFNPGAGVNSSPNRVSAVAAQPDGKVLIGGNFTTINGTNRNRIARLNANGSLDLDFKPGTGVDGVVRSIVLQPDGNLLIGGDFTSVNGVLRPYVARLHGDSAVALPSLTIARTNASVTIAWPVTALNLQLQESTNLALANAWFPVIQPIVTNGAQISVAVPASADRKFFRLKSP